MTGGIDPQLQSHKDRAVQLAASIQNTKDIIAGNFEFIISKKNFEKKKFQKFLIFFSSDENKTRTWDGRSK